jgi:hypothetical protein
MIAEIVNQLKTGTLTSVVPFGRGTKMPTAPYVVVKPELYINGRGIRVIVHYTPGTQLYTDASTGAYMTPLDDYIYHELPSLLADWSFENNHGETMTVRDTGEITDVSAVSDDNTVSMDRLFYIAQPK